MRPHPSIEYHPAFPILMQYAKLGCPVDCGPNWSLDHLQAAIHRGNHPSALMPDARDCLRAEALEKVQTGLAKLVNWTNIQACPPPNLKISPLAAVPHKSWQFRAILDLSFQLRMGGIRLPSVNAATRKQAHQASMHQLGKVLP